MAPQRARGHDVERGVRGGDGHLLLDGGLETLHVKGLGGAGLKLSLGSLGSLGLHVLVVRHLGLLLLPLRGARAAG